MPLTVSPFVSLPTAATLPYTYKSMPSALPPPVTGVTGAATDDGAKPRYVVSPSGHAAHPDEIVASCEALRAHIFRRREATGAALRGLEDRIRERELAEKRRVAPGWLDSDARLLEPERKFSGSAGGGAGGIGSAFEVADSDAEIEATSRRIAEMNVSPELEGVSEMPAVDEGAELDRAFGLK